MYKRNTRRGFTQINQVILNLIQDLVVQIFKEVRFQIKFAMTPLLNNGGFTLIELLVVVLIIGILSAVALPQYQKAVAKARVTQWLALTDAFKKGADAFILENGWPPANEIWTFTGTSANKMLNLDLPASPTSGFYFSTGAEGDGTDSWYSISGYTNGADLVYEKLKSTGSWQGTCMAFNSTWLSVCKSLKMYDYECYDSTGGEGTFAC